MKCFEVEFFDVIGGRGIGSYTTKAEAYDMYDFLSTLDDTTKILVYCIENGERKILKKFCKRGWQIAPNVL